MGLARGIQTGGQDAEGLAGDVVAGDGCAADVDGNVADEPGGLFAGSAAVGRDHGADAGAYRVYQVHLGFAKGWDAGGVDGVGHGERG